MYAQNRSSNYRRTYARDSWRQENDRYPRKEYAANYNPSKGVRFSGYYDADGNFHDLD